MGKGMLRAALVCLGLLVGAGSARADVLSVLVKSDTLAVTNSDSTAAKYVGNTARMWLDFISVPPSATFAADTTGYGTWNVTPILLAVQVREVLTRAAGLDTTAGILGGGNLRVSAAASDTTVVAWNPRAWITATSGDSAVTVNRFATNGNTAGSSEFMVWIQPNVGKWTNARSTRVELINAQNGVPFRAQFASFRWRMVSGPAVVRLRVVLGQETF